MDFPSNCSGYDPFFSLDSDSLEDVSDIIQSYNQQECPTYPSQSSSPVGLIGDLSPTLGLGGTADISDILNMLKGEDASLHPFPHSSSTNGSYHQQPFYGSHQPASSYAVHSGRLFNPDSPSNHLSLSPLHIQTQSSPPAGYAQPGFSSAASSRLFANQGPTGSPVAQSQLSPASQTKQNLLNAIAQMNKEQIQTLMGGNVVTTQPTEQTSSAHLRSSIVGVATKFSLSDHASPPQMTPLPPPSAISPVDRRDIDSRSIRPAPFSEGSAPFTRPMSPPNVVAPLISLTATTESQAQQADELMGETNDEAEDDSVDSSSCFSPDPTGDGGQPLKRKGQRGERKTAHNLIEKRYRTSINDRIQELKVKLVGADGKMNKSGVLKKALDYIDVITKQNQALLKENMEMKKALADKGGVREILISGACSSGNESKPNTTGLKGPTNGSAPKRTRLMSSLTPQAMLDRSRVSLLGFMLLVLMINPFGIVLNVSPAGKVASALPGGHGPSRTLLTAYDFADELDRGWMDGNFRLLCIWILNLIVIGCVLARLLIYGEPICTEQNSLSWTSFWKLKAQAESDLERNDVAAAVFNFSECLKVLGRPLPVTTVDQWSALLWQVSRQFLNRVVVGKWLSKQRRGGIKPFSVMQSHGHAAMIYHRLQQLHLMGFVSDSTVSGLTLSLSAVNLAEAAGKAICPSRLVEIYVAAAMQMRRAAPTWTLAARYFLTRSRHACKRGDVLLPQNLFWVFQPVGHQFFVANSLSLPRDTSLFVNTGTDCNLKPLDILASEFKLFLLKQLAECLIFGTGKASSSASCGRFIKRVNGHIYADVLEYGQLLLECGKSGRRDGCVETTDKCPETTDGDDVCLWWASLLGCSMNWAAGDLNQAKLKYAAVRSIPTALLSHPLAMAVGNAFCARKVLLENFATKNCDRVVWVHCCKASEFLESVGGTDSSSGLDKEMQAYVRIMAHQWILTCLLGVWERHVKVVNVYWQSPGTGELTSVYYRNLECLRHASKAFPLLNNKTLLFEIAGRMINGANPVATGEMLNRCISIYSDIDYASTDFELKQLAQLKLFHSGLLQSWSKTLH